jgi:hypothetical protein
MPVKITNSETIKSSERELIDAITGDLDWSTIEELIRERHKLNIQDDVAYTKGDIIVHESQVAYQLDFEVKMNLSVIFDRKGNFLSLNTNEADDAESSPESAAPPSAPDETRDETPADDHQEPAPTEAAPPSADASSEILQMTSEIADMSEEASDTLEASLDDTTDSGNSTSSWATAMQAVRPEDPPQEKMADMASQIASMISEINEDPH